MKKFLLLILLLFTTNANAQFVRMFAFGADPTGGCQLPSFGQNIITGNLFYCKNGTWTGVLSSASALTISGVITAGGFATGTGAPTSNAIVIDSVHTTLNAGVTWHLDNNNAGNAAFAGIQIENNTATSDGGILVYSGGFTTANAAIQDSARLYANSGLSGGLVIGTVGTNPLSFSTNNVIRAIWSGDGTTFLPTDNVTSWGDATHRLTGVDSVIIYTPTINTRSGSISFGSTAITPASSGVRFLCISTTGVVTSSASACVGT